MVAELFLASKEPCDGTTGRQQTNHIQLTRLHRRKKARTRVAVKLHALYVDITVVFWTPKFEQDVLSRTALLVRTSHSPDFN